MIFKRLHNEDKAGLYLTLILHLAIVIVLLLLQITRELTAENSFVMDFTREEELERQEAERAFKEDISERLDELIRSRCQEIRNVAIDASAPLKDDRNTPAEDLYTKGIILGRISEFFKSFEIFWSAFTITNLCEDFKHAFGTDTAWGTFTT